MLILVRSRNWQNIRIRWFRRASSVLINHRKCSFSADKGSRQKACNHQKYLNRQKESSCFRTSQMSKISAMMRNTTAESLPCRRWCTFVASIRKVRSTGVLSTAVIISNPRRAVIGRYDCTELPSISVESTPVIITRSFLHLKTWCVIMNPEDRWRQPPDRDFINKSYFQKSGSRVLCRLSKCLWVQQVSRVKETWSGKQVRSKTVLFQSS